MGQPVKLSDELISDARIFSKGIERSLAGQVEIWARIGRAFEPHLTVRQVGALAKKRPLADCIKEAGTPEGDRRLKQYLKTRPFPHYEAAPGNSGLLVRTEANGRRTVGKFVDREFQAVGKQSH